MRVLFYFSFFTRAYFIGENVLVPQYFYYGPPSRTTVVHIYLRASLFTSNKDWKLLMIN